MKEVALKELIKECSAQIIQKTREIYTLIPGMGDVNSEIMFITSSPSAKEEKAGIYFEEKIGLDFDLLLEDLKLSREQVYMTYAVKYRPYKVNNKTGRIVSRDVTDDEMMTFYPFLLKEIEIIKPSMIITLGDLPYSILNKGKALTPDKYGNKSTIRLDQIDYNTMALPHPSQAEFKKVVLNSGVVERLNQKNGNKANDSKPISTNTFTSIKLEKVFEQQPKNSQKQKSKGEQQPKIIPKQALKGKSKPKVIKEQTVETEYESQIIPKQKSGIKRRRRRTSGKRKVIVVYGGSNLVNDPTSVAVERVSSVLTELNMTVKRLDLYKTNYKMESFLSELNGADGVILATTVEWYGIGGLLQDFLDKCFASGQLDYFDGAYLFAIVISRQGYERDALTHLLKSWEILGGVEGVTICASIESSADIETDSDLLGAIDKKAEDYYRVISQQRVIMPTSIHDHKVLVKIPVRIESHKGEQTAMEQAIENNGVESVYDNQMSFISNYDEFIEKQQQDIEDIASLFKERLSTKGDIGQKTYPELFEYKYKPDRTFSDCTISWIVNDKKSKSVVLIFEGAVLKAKYSKKTEADVVMSSDHDILQKIVEGRLTVQRAFMTGEIKAKGNFTLLYKLDQLFAF